MSRLLYKTGQLAKKAGVTVKTLHHYDKTGLLKPSGERESGHRLYLAKDVQRLSQIIVLKDMGLPLSDIRSLLDDESIDLMTTLKMHRDYIRSKVDSLTKILNRMEVITASIENSEQQNLEELFNLTKEIQLMEDIYTPEQVKYLKERLDRYPKEVKDVEKAWPVLFKKFEEAMTSGLPVTDATVQDYAKQAQHFISLFSGGDKEIEKNLDKAYEQNQQNALKMWGVKKEVFDYAHKARSAYLKTLSV